MRFIVYMFAGLAGGILGGMGMGGGTVLGYIILPALVLSVAGGLLVNRIGGEALQKGFGIFLCLLSVWQFISASKSIAAKKREDGALF